MCKSLSSNFACLQGKAERDACYKPIIEEIQRIFPGTEWLGNYTFLYVVSNLKVSISMKETFLICLYQQIHKYRMCKISNKSRGRKIPMCNLIITKITTAATMMIVMMMIMMMMLITERSKRITILMIILIALINIKDFFQAQNG